MRTAEEPNDWPSSANSSRDVLSAHCSSSKSMSRGPSCAIERSHCLKTWVVMFRDRSELMSMSSLVEQWGST